MKSNGYRDVHYTGLQSTQTRKIIAATTLPLTQDAQTRGTDITCIFPSIPSNSCMIIVDMLINSIELSSSAATDVGMSLLLVY